MSDTVEFHKSDLDIIGDVLNSVALVGMYRGKEAWDAIERLMSELSDNTLVLIDIKRASPLQYEFCQYAFGPLFEALNSGRWLHKYVIFQMYDFHKPGFFRGVLKHLGTELARKESEKGFVSAGFYAKLVVGDEKLISFVGSLSESQQRILDVVNEMKEVAAKQVVEKLDLSEESVVDELRFLVRKYFVVESDRESDPIPRYYSFYNYL